MNAPVKEKLKEGIDYYYNEQGQFVFTEQYHLSKGYCCGLNCLHCPFGHEAVSTARRKCLQNTHNQSTHAEKKS
jgi:hypothetical protein